MKRLPDAEFEVMKVLWAMEPPVTANMILEELGCDWKVQTAMSLLARLTERGFIRTEKNGRLRSYYPITKKEEYLEFETGNFMKQYHGDSFVSVVTSLYDGKKISNNDIDELLKWIKEREE